MNRLIFLCGYDDFYYGLASMTARTIRDSGYDDELIIFTIEDKHSPYGTCVNLATHPQTELIRLKKGAFFHKRLCTKFGYPQYAHPCDYFIIKTLPGMIVDRNRYDFILYMDSDILVHPRQSLDDIFQSPGPISDFNSRPAIRDVKGLRAYFTEAEARAATELRGIGGGAFGIPRAHFGFFDLYREYYLRYLEEIPHDQPVLSFVKVRYYARHPFEQWPNRKYFRHYWGDRKKEMLEDYAKRYGEGSVREILPALT